MFIALAVLAALVRTAPPLRSSLLKVGFTVAIKISKLTTRLDSKQARDLIGVLRESNQKIDPRLSEMARFGGGGGGGRGRYGGGGRGRGGRAFNRF